jgi:hypothetical protein
VTVQGQGTWQANYGGSYGLLQAQLQGNGFQAQARGQVYGGQDPYQSTPTQFFFQGNFPNTCDPTAIAL